MGNCRPIGVTAPAGRKRLPPGGSLIYRSEKLQFLPKKRPGRTARAQGYFTDLAYSDGVMPNFSLNCREK